MASNASKIRKLLKDIEKDASAMASFREWAKYDTKLTPFGAAVVEAAKDNEVPQWVIAQLLDVTSSAISKRYQ